MGREIIDSSVLDDYRKVMGDQGEAFVRDLVRAFIEDSNGLAEMLASSWEDQDANTFRRAAHGLKTTSLTMGALHLADQFAVLERNASMGEMDDEALYNTTISSLERARKELSRLYLQ
jgi:HPt (histidine-containing phosphotransfer) domain-containing protein